MKYLIFDSSSIINIISTGLTEVLRNLKSKFNGEFLITKEVKYETIEHPMRINRFEWGALRIKQVLDDKTLKIAETIFNEGEIKKESQKILSIANNTFFVEEKAIHILDNGEAECLALSNLLNQKGIKNMVVIDERTARMLCENPDNLAKIFETKMHIPIKTKKKNYGYFTEFKVIRSTELAYIAYKKGLIKIKDSKALEAILYALKYGGCSVSEKEIKVLKK